MSNTSIFYLHFLFILQYFYLGLYHNIFLNSVFQVIPARSNPEICETYPKINLEKDCLVSGFEKL